MAENVNSEPLNEAGKKRLPGWAVIVIVFGILAFLVFAALIVLGGIASNGQDKAAVSVAKSDAKTIAESMEDYYTANQAYPLTAGQFASAGGGSYLSPGDVAFVSVLDENGAPITEVGMPTFAFRVCVYDAQSARGQSVVYDSVAGGFQPDVEGAAACGPVGAWNPNDVTFKLG